MKRKLPAVLAVMLIMAAAYSLMPAPVSAASAAEINRDVTAALEQLYANNPTAKVIGEKAVAVLVFPSITKGGFIVGGQYGVGALRKAARRLATTTPLPGHGAYRLVSRSTDMPCSS